MATPAEDEFPRPQIQGNLNPLKLQGINPSIPRELGQHETIGANPTANQCKSRLALPQGLILSVRNIRQIDIL